MNSDQFDPMTKAMVSTYLKIPPLFLVIWDRPKAEKKLDLKMCWNVQKWGRNVEKARRRRKIFGDGTF